MKVILALMIWVIIGLCLFIAGRSIYRFIKKRIEKKKEKEVEIIDNDIENQEKGE